MLLWVVLVFLITLLFSAYREGFTPMKDELTIPNELPEMKESELQDLLDGGVLLKDIDMVRIQELLVVLDKPAFKEIIDADSGYISNLMERSYTQQGMMLFQERGKEILDLYQIKFYDDYNTLLELYPEIDRTSVTTYNSTNPTIKQRAEYYANFDTSTYDPVIQKELERLKGNVHAAYNQAIASYSRYVAFYKSGFRKNNNKIVTKNHNFYLISQGIDNSNFITEYKATLFHALQMRLAKQSTENATNALDFATKNAQEIQPTASLSFFATIMDKLNVLEKKDIVPVFTNKPVNILTVDRYLDPSCKEGESLFCSGEIRCTDIYGNEIPGLMKSEVNASYRHGTTHSNCGTYTKRIEYKDWIKDMSKNLLVPATEFVAYDTSNCTITKPWKLTGPNMECYMDVEKAQDAYLKTRTATNELLLGTIVLLERNFLEEFFDRNPESIFKLNHPNENIQVQRLKYKGNMQSSATQYNDKSMLIVSNQDIDRLKRLPKVSVDQDVYYKAKITQINKDGYDLVIPDDYGIKVSGIKKEFLLLPDVSYLKNLNETLTDATVNSMPRPMCSGYFSKCSTRPNIQYDPTDTLKKNLIHNYEKAAPYLLTSTESSDNCPSTTSSTGSLGFSLF